MEETNNATQGNASTFEFDAGGHAFFQNTANADFSRYFKPGGIEGMNIAFGTEYRYENFQVIPGSVPSYGNYDINGNLVTSITPDSLMPKDFLGRSRPSGSQCFAGFLPSNQINARRSSIAGYLDTEFDLTKNFLVNAAARYENYSDFGSTFNYKVAGRYKFGNISLRAATSTGFRAPSLHQIHFSRTSTIFVTQNNQTVAQEVGVFANTSRAAQLLGIPKLKQETSQNLSAGITAKFPDAGLRITLDGYLVNIKDRIVLTGQFGPGSDPELQQIFRQAQADAAAFFANAIDTRSVGLDVVVSHSTLLGTSGMTLRNDFAATFTKTTREGDIKASPLLKEKGLVGTYFNEESRIYLEEAVPRIKFTLSNSLDIKNLSIYLRNTYFGPTTEATDISALAPGVDYINSGKVITDLSVRYAFTNNWSLTVGSNNLLDIYPDESDPAFQSDGRFLYSRRSPQFSFGGRFLFARLGFSLQ
jgi:iron complex outermembrane receptor protein